MMLLCLGQKRAIGNVFGVCQVVPNRLELTVGMTVYPKNEGGRMK